MNLRKLAEAAYDQAAQDARDLAAQQAQTATTLPDSQSRKRTYVHRLPPTWRCLSTQRSCTTL